MDDAVVLLAKEDTPTALLTVAGLKGKRDFLKLLLHLPLKRLEALSISRGNANMNLRELISWGLIFLENRPGERREYFYAGKDIWEVAQRTV